MRMFFFSSSQKKLWSFYGQCQRVFSATFNEAGLKSLPSAIAHRRNAPRTSTERYKVKYFKERGTVIHFKLLFLNQNGKTWKDPPEFFKFNARVTVVSIMISLLFSASLHLHCYFYKKKNSSCRFPLLLMYSQGFSLLYKCHLQKREKPWERGWEKSLYEPLRWRVILYIDILIQSLASLIK